MNLSYSAIFLLLILFQLTHAQNRDASATDNIPTVAYCEMVRHPSLYFDKPVRLTARLELATEGSYLRSEECALSHDDQIGVSYTQVGEPERDQRNRESSVLHTNEYGGRARVTVVGILRNASLRSFSWYRYRFDIIRFERISRVVITYESALQTGLTYRASVRADKIFGLSLVAPLQAVEHHAVRIEWTNLRAFPVLKRLGESVPARTIVFSVVSDQVTQMTESRWNRTIRCKIIKVE